MSQTIGKIHHSESVLLGVFNYDDHCIYTFIYIYMYIDIYVYRYIYKYPYIYMRMHDVHTGEAGGPVGEGGRGASRLISAARVNIPRTPSLQFTMFYYVLLCSTVCSRIRLLCFTTFYCVLPYVWQLACPNVW